MDYSGSPLLLLLVLLLVSLAAVHVSASSKRPRKLPLFVFGDSQFDAGNNNYIATNNKANFYPYGITHLPESGRFSNGYMFADYVAKYLRIPRPKPYLAAPNKRVTKGLNFASGGAGILNTTDTGRAISMSQQLGYYLGLRLSGKMSNKVASRAVYLVNFGANDLFNVPKDPTKIPAFIGTLVRNYAAFFKALYDAGARNFIYVTTPPVGCVPASRAILGATDALGCNAAANALAGTFNAAVISALASPAFIFSPALGTKLATLDWFSSILALIPQKEKYGFNSMDACCGGPGALNGIVFCGTSAQITATGDVVQGNVNYVLCKDTYFLGHVPR